MGTNRAEELAAFWYNKHGKLSPKVVEINAFIAGYNSRQSEIKSLTKEVERLRNKYESKEIDIICPKCKGVNEYTIDDEGYKTCAYTDCQTPINH